jgi:hypothetical protein
MPLRSIRFNSDLLNSDWLEGALRELNFKLQDFQVLTFNPPRVWFSSAVLRNWRRLENQ